MINSKHIKSLLYVSILLHCATAEAGIIKGKIYDRVTNEQLIRATILPDSSTKGTVTDIDGNYNVQLQDGLHSLSVKYIGYSGTILSVKVPIGAEYLTLEIPMSQDFTSLSEVTVIALARKDTETAMIEEEKKSDVVQTGVFGTTDRKESGQVCLIGKHHVYP